MKEHIEHIKLFKAAEVKLSYVTNKKPSERIKIESPDDAVELLMGIWDQDSIEHIEEVKIILLNRANQVLGVATISKGGLSGSVIDTRVIMQYAINANASAVILAHNHPSGNLKPSEADKKITKRIKDALELFDINLLDHIIMTGERRFSSVMDEI